jgi:polyribonucleotide nucleotidyltransferase
MFVRESVMVGGRPLTIETGRLAKQAHGAVLVSYGESSVLVSAVSTEERPGLDFFPLTCDYVEKTYAAGKIPGGFFKREGRLRDYETLTARLMDRPLRPLFPKGYRKDTQIIATVLSSDKENPTDVLALTGASAAVHLSPIPWDGPVVVIRVARVHGEFIPYPTFDQIDRASIDLVVAASHDAIVMVEGGAAEATEAEIIDTLMFAHEQGRAVLDLIERLRAAVGRPKREYAVEELDPALARRVADLCDEKLKTASVIRDKQERYAAYAEIKAELGHTLAAELGEQGFAEQEQLAKVELEHRKAAVVRNMVLSERRRIDGRAENEIRPISCEVGLLPRTHGSALFQRGETQAIVTTTLGTASDEQKIDALIGESWKHFMLHYNFPPFCTGEIKPLRGPGRREIGHGALAERALSRMIPDHDTFPYTIRVVSEILESNGSSSMASVCGGTLSLMDCGVPIQRPVAGIAMGLIKEGDQIAVLSDILGDEDHLGDMDFKVCGTDRGVTGAGSGHFGAGAGTGARGTPAHPGQDAGNAAGNAGRDQPVGAAHHHHPGQARSDPHHYRSGRQDDQRHRGSDRLYHRRGGRRHGQCRLGGSGGRQARAGHHPGAYRRTRGRQGVRRRGQAHRRLRGLRRDLAEHRGSAARVRDRT